MPPILHSLPHPLPHALPCLMSHTPGAPGVPARRGLTACTWAQPTEPACREGGWAASYLRPSSPHADTDLLSPTRASCQTLPRLSPGPLPSPGPPTPARSSLHPSGRVWTSPPLQGEQLHDPSRGCWEGRT